jgi:2-dehydropantoate 2-reductase
MKIAVMAAGAVGGYCGARLAATGHDVHFIARGENLKAMKANGLKLESVHGDLHLKKVNVTPDPAQIGPADVVLFAVKLWDTEKAAEQARPLIGPNTRLITFQNGVDSVERIGPIIGAEHTVGGVAAIASVIASPGVIRHTSSFATFRFGHKDGHGDPVLHNLVEAGMAAKLDIGISADIESDRWQKFIFLTAMSGATSALRSPIGPIVADPELRAFFRQLMDEATAVGRAKGVKLDQAVIDARMEFVIGRVEPGMKASMAHDLDRGNRIELDWLSGKVRQFGRELGIPTPASDTVWTVLKLHRMGTQG